MLEQNTSHEILQKLHPAELWKMFFDGKFHKQGPQVFDADRSPGFLKAMCNAFNYLLEHLDEPLSVQLFEALQEKSTCKIPGDVKIYKQYLDLDYSEAYIFEMLQARTHLRTTEGGFPIRPPQEDNRTPDNPLEYSLQGLEDLISGHILEPGTFHFNQLDDEHFLIPEEAWESSETLKAYLDEVGGRFCSSLTGDGLTNAINTITQLYYEEIGIAQTDEDKLIAIARVTRALLVLHPFEDGNGRTFRMFILNKLLIENGLAPTILEVQETISLHSIDEMVPAIQKGQLTLQYNYQSNKNSSSFLSMINTDDQVCLHIEPDSNHLADLLAKQIAYRISKRDNCFEDDALYQEFIEKFTRDLLNSEKTTYTGKEIKTLVNTLTDLLSDSNVDIINDDHNLVTGEYTKPQKNHYCTFL